MIYNMDGHGENSRGMRGFGRGASAAKPCADAGLFRPRTGLKRCKKRVDIILLPWCNSITNKSGKAKRFPWMRSGMDA